MVERQKGVRDKTCTYSDVEHANLHRMRTLSNIYRISPFMQARGVDAVFEKCKIEGI